MEQQEKTLEELQELYLKQGFLVIVTDEPIAYPIALSSLGIIGDEDVQQAARWIVVDRSSLEEMSPQLIDPKWMPPPLYYYRVEAMPD